MKSQEGTASTLKKKSNKEYYIQMKHFAGKQLKRNCGKCHNFIRWNKTLKSTIDIKSHDDNFLSSQGTLGTPRQRSRHCTE